MPKTFNVMCKEGDKIIAYATWEDTEDNRRILEEWSEFGYVETPDNYVQGYDGEWYLKGTEPEKPAPTAEEIRQARANAYANEVDPLMAEYNRKKTFGLFEGSEEAELLARIEAKVAEIKETYPYPEETLTESSSSNIIELSEIDINSILGE